ncbi:MAG: HAMP domain-containing histidine kinase [Burkholderiaceae bacterium]|nr:HAMP domain-containing histidine kinase [Burkholderiaceae bacterium]
MRRLSQPTLVRRVVLALMLAFLGVWLILLAVLFFSATSQESLDQSVTDVGDGLLMSLAPLVQAGEASAVAAATSSQINYLYQRSGTPAAMLVQLDDHQGRRLYLSAQARGVELPAALRAGELQDGVIGGRVYRVFHGAAGPWRVTVAGSRVDDVWLLKSLGADLAGYLLIALPLTMLPVWLAVTGGLRPLRELSRRVAARGSDDLAPLGLTPPYAELRPLAAALDDLLAQLRARVAREHQFVHDAAHELRTPMAVISMQAHVLALESDAAQRRIAGQQLDDAIARASHLTQQLLHLAKADGGNVLPAAVDIAELTRQELLHAARRALDSGHELSLDAPDALPFKLEIPSYQSILANLLDNALRYVPSGGRIAVQLRMADQLLQLSVADDGPGIAAELRETVFERFHRGSDHVAPGSGLGLAIVRQAVQRMRGNVRLTAGLDGRGCTFTVTIPCAPG